jgi:hypothetical protein
MRWLVFATALILCLFANAAHAADKTIGVFVALADNKSQGIVPVPAKIGNGEDPENNLYWGNSEGLKGYFDHSHRWKLIARNDIAKGDILRTRTYRHVDRGATLFASAYRGSAIKRCLSDYETAVQSGTYDLVVFIGHNGLMDFNLPQPAKSRRHGKRPDCVVLCCKSESYFKTRLTDAGGRPAVLTTQLMYPGAFILGAISETWLAGGKLSALRESAGGAYAANQKISRRSGVGVFARLND